MKRIGAFLAALAFGATFAALVSVGSNAQAAPAPACGTPDQVAGFGSSGLPGTVTPASLTFGYQQPFTGRSSPQTLTYHNTSSQIVDGFDCAAVGGEPPLLVTGCNSAIPPNGTCTISVVFAPQRGGSQTDSQLGIHIDWGNNETGDYNNIQPPVTVHFLPLVFTPHTLLAFGPVPQGTTKTMTVKMENYWDTSVSPSIAVHGAGFTITGGAASCASIPSWKDSGSCSLRLGYSPPAGLHVGPAQGRLQVSFPPVNGAPVPAETVALTGTGTAAPVIRASVAGLHFASRQAETSSPPQTVTFTNVGAATQSDTGCFLFRGSNYLVSGCPRPTQIRPGQSITAMVVYRPQSLTQELPVARNDVLSFGPSSADSVSVDLFGGQPYPLLFTPSAVAFPPTPDGQAPPPQTVTVRNMWVDPVDITSWNLDNFHKFVAINHCPARLASGATCQITVQGSASSTGFGPWRGDITVYAPFYGGPLASEVLPVTGTTTERAAAVRSTGPSPPAPTAALASTGAAVGTCAASGAALLVLGVAALCAGRDRRRRHIGPAHE